MTDNLATSAGAEAVPVTLGRHEVLGVLDGAARSASVVAVELRPAHC